MTSQAVPYQSALILTLETISHGKDELLPLDQITDRTLAEDVFSKADSPSSDASLKDGYAVRSKDVLEASQINPVRLRMIGSCCAGSTEKLMLEPGTAVRILTGGIIPENSDAVLAEEFTSRDGVSIHAINNAEPGRNILQRGADVKLGQQILLRGNPLHPAAVGLLASAGLTHLRVYTRPSVAILATGDEIIAPGTPLKPGKLYASNLVTLAAWCARSGFPTCTCIVKDNLAEIMNAISQASNSQDVVLTSGGAWSGDRDLVVQALNLLGWEQFYNRVRMGPGKGVSFGMLLGKPVFCLPGGPPSNLIAFLELALPALQKMAGVRQPGLPAREVILGETVSGQIDWTQFLFGQITGTPGTPEIFTPMPHTSRLQLLALAQAVLTIPEGTCNIPQGALVPVQILS